jgi:hypothetical protein
MAMVLNANADSAWFAALKRGGPNGGGVFEQDSATMRICKTRLNS